ncbi:hypothetical protein L1887_58670 [Cichorium endivia]|nr:hypothetical protein L1887_58670 [Cichorium endivia]
MERTPYLQAKLSIRNSLEDARQFVDPDTMAVASAVVASPAKPTNRVSAALSPALGVFGRQSAHGGRVASGSGPAEYGCGGELAQATHQVEPQQCRYPAPVGGTLGRWQRRRECGRERRGAERTDGLGKVVSAVRPAQGAVGAGQGPCGRGCGDDQDDHQGHGHQAQWSKGAGGPGCTGAPPSSSRAQRERVNLIILAIHKQLKACDPGSQDDAVAESCRGCQ